MVNYTVGSTTVPGKPKKVKRTGPPPTSKKEGEESREKRLQSFTPKDNKRVAASVKINTNTNDALKQGLKLNDHGIPDGDQRQKQFNLKKPLAPKFRK